MTNSAIGKVVKSNTHIDYVCQVYGRGELLTPPLPTDYAFGEFVAIELDGATDDGCNLLVGIIYNTYWTRLVYSMDAESIHADLEDATAACEAHARDLGDAEPDAYYQLNMRFHEVVAISSGNPFLLDLVKTNGRKLLAYYRAAYRYPGTIAHSAQEHRTLATLIAQRQADEAEALMIRHLGFDHATVMDLLAALA